MNMTRMDFLQGALASMGFGALAGRRLFAVAPETDASGFGDLELVLGVVTDTHMQGDWHNKSTGFWRSVANKHPNPWYQDGPFWKALQYFKANKVDAVIHCGDMADCGYWKEILFHADVWHGVFGDDVQIDDATAPGGKRWATFIDDATAPGGRREVRKLFVLGNHDWANGEGFVKKDKTDPPYGVVCHLGLDNEGRHHDQSFYEAWLNQPYWKNWPGAWEYLRERDLWSDPKVWGEKYESYWHKVICGRHSGSRYHFFGCFRPGYHSADVSDPELANLIQMAELMKTARAGDSSFDSKPFFTLMHVWPHQTKAAELLSTCDGNTCYGNGICFYGHGHYNLTAGSPFTFERGGQVFCVKGGMMKRGYNALNQKMAAVFASGFGDGVAAGTGDHLNMNHGWLLKVYSRCIVFHPVDFECFLDASDASGYNMTDKTIPPGSDHHCAPLGPDYVLRLEDGWASSYNSLANHPFAPDNLVSTLYLADGKDPAPQFGPTARPALDYAPDYLIVTIPRADGNISVDGDGCVESDGVVTGARAFGYNVEVAGSGGVYRSSVYANGCYSGIGVDLKENGGATVFSIPRTELPTGDTLTVTVWPCSCYGVRGRPISATERRLRVELEKSVPSVDRGGRFVLTNGANLPPDTKLWPSSAPWVKEVRVENGEIVAYTRPVGATVAAE